MQKGVFFIFFCLRLYILVNNFSVILGQLLGFNQYYAMGMKCLAQGHNTTPPGRGSNPQPCNQEFDILPTELSVLLQRFFYDAAQIAENRNFPKFLDILKTCCNHTKIRTNNFYHREMSPKDADGNELTLHSDLGLHCLPGPTCLKT